MNGDSLIQTVIEKQNWEDVIYHIVTLENMNPWDIDIIRLTDSFLRYIENVERLDFRIPAKVVVVAAILLKLKAEELYKMEEEKLDFVLGGITSERDYEQIRERMKQLSLKPPMQRMPKRKVTLDELVNALKKAVKIQYRKEEKTRRIRRRVEEQIETEEEDIEVRINRLMDDIDMLLAKLKSERVEFSDIVDKWEREDIVRHFLPLLHLATRGRVETKQEEFFKEIFISKRNEP